MSNEMMKAAFLAKTVGLNRMSMDERKAFAMQMKVDSDIKILEKGFDENSLESILEYASHACDVVITPVRVKNKELAMNPDIFAQYFPYHSSIWRYHCAKVRNKPVSELSSILLNVIDELKEHQLDSPYAEYLYKLI